MNAEEAIKKAIEIVREERCSCACTIHNTNTTGETCDDCGRIDALMGDLEDAAALIRSQADDLRAIEGAFVAEVDTGVIYEKNESPPWSARTDGKWYNFDTLADACRAATGEKA